MRVKKFMCLAIGFMTMLVLQSVYASVTVPMYLMDANQQQKSMGTVKIEKAICGILITPDLQGLPPGIHGFHVHEHASCDDKAMAAGGHLDPTNTKKHNGPYREDSHLGDLPVLIVNAEGRATLPLLAPRLTLAKIKGHALMIHAGGDNYSDQPGKLGGGGPRIACGVIQ